MNPNPAPPGAVPRRWGRGTAAVALAAAIAVAACSTSEGTSGTDGAGDTGGAGADGAAEGSSAEERSAWRYPGDEWERVAPETAGFDLAGLDRLAEDAAAARSHCLVVTRDGAVVDERYGDGVTADTPREAFSATKSVTSTLVGIAQDQGALALDDPAADHIPAWQGTEAEAVSVEHLLSNVSGRHWDPATDYGAMAIQAHDKTAFAIDLAQDEPPGTTWAYNNAAVQTLSAVLEGATGQRADDYAESVLFEPLGMRSSSLASDPAGNPLTFMGLQTTCLDLARFGYLMLRDGAWDGSQVVSEDVVEQATGRPSTELNAAYGFLWWLNHRGPVASPLLATTGAGDNAIADGQLVPAAPGDTFWALGFRNQILAVIPSEGIVAVRLGPAPPEGVTFTHAELTLGVLDALVEVRG
ncbi:MAG TPA: serine hydrolase [Acidimicrobiales bacterium]